MQTFFILYKNKNKKSNPVIRGSVSEWTRYYSQSHVQQINTHSVRDKVY